MPVCASFYSGDVFLFNCFESNFAGGRRVVLGLLSKTVAL